MEFQMNKFETMTLVEIIEDANLRDDILEMEWESFDITAEDEEEFLKGPK